MKVIEVRSVTIRLRGNLILEDASAAFEEGSITGLVGPNGVGKSVLLRAICGFLPVTSGEIWTDPRFYPRGRRYPDLFGVTIDGPAYLPHSTGLENLVELAGIRRRIGVDDVRREMRSFGLDPDNRARVRNYSMGMKQKLALAQAFMEQPEVLILDEPFNALDSESARELRTRLLAFRDGGGTVIFTSHRTADIQELSDSVYRIADRSLALARG